MALCKTVLNITLRRMHAPLDAREDGALQSVLDALSHGQTSSLCLQNCGLATIRHLSAAAVNNPKRFQAIATLDLPSDQSHSQWKLGHQRAIELDKVLRVATGLNVLKLSGKGFE